MTKRRLRIVGAVSGGILGLCVLLYGSARLLLFIEARRAAALLTQLNNVRLGDEEASIRPLLQRYEDLRSEREIGEERGSYILRVDPWHFYRPFVGPHWIDAPVREAIDEFGRLRRGLELRAWVVNGGIKLKKDRVESVSADVMVEGENEWLMAKWNYVSDIPASETKLYKEHGLFRPEMERYLVGWTHLHMGLETGEGVCNLIIPVGNTDEQRAARNINLLCLTSTSGCHSLCELMPDADRYRRHHDFPRWGWNSGSWAAQDHACE